MAITYSPAPSHLDCVVCPPCEPTLPPVKCTTRAAVRMTSIDDLVHEPRYAAVGAPVDYVKHNIVMSAIIVARDLRCLKRTVHADVQKGVRDYYPCPEPDERWGAVISVSVCGSCVDFINPLLCDHNCSFAVGGYASFLAPHAILLNELPDRDICNAISMTMVAVPTRDACNLDADFVEMYGEAIQTRAIGMMRLDKGSNKNPYDWYDPALARELINRFERDLMGRHKIDRAQESGRKTKYEGPG